MVILMVYEKQNIEEQEVEALRMKYQKYKNSSCDECGGKDREVYGIGGPNDTDVFAYCLTCVLTKMEEETSNRTLIRYYRNGLLSEDIVEKYQIDKLAECYEGMKMQKKLIEEKRKLILNRNSC